MTKVNLTVTKQLEQVPDEVEKQLHEVVEKLREILQKSKYISQGFAYGLPLDKTAEAVLNLQNDLPLVGDMYQDIANICYSYGKIEKERENREREESLSSKVREEVADFKFQAEAKIGQLSATNKMLSEQLEILSKKLEEVEINTSQSKSSAKSTKKKTSTRK